MGKGSTAPAGGTTRTVSLPEYADPYFRRLLKGAEEATQPFYPDDPDTYGDLAGESTYVPYGDERIAPSEDYGDINTSRAMVRGIAETPIGGLDEAVALQRRGIAGLEGLANYNTGAFDEYTGFQAGRADPYAGFRAGSADPFADFRAGRGTEYTGFQAGRADPYAGFRAGSADPFADFQEANFSAQTADQYDFDPARQFTGTEVQQYMDPYMQNVVDVQKREAREDFGRSQAARDAGAISAGAFGGSRQAVQQGMAEEGLQEQLGDIQAAGSQAAFQQAMKAFESDRAAQMEVDARRAAELGRILVRSAEWKLAVLGKLAGYRTLERLNLHVPKALVLMKRLESRGQRRLNLPELKGLAWTKQLEYSLQRLLKERVCRVLMLQKMQGCKMHVQRSLRAHRVLVWMRPQGSKRLKLRSLLVSKV